MTPQPSPRNLGSQRPSPQQFPRLSQPDYLPLEQTEQSCWKCSETSPGDDPEEPSTVPEHLKQFVITPENALLMRAKILGTINKINRQAGLDRESLCQDIWLEAWQKGIPVTEQFIKHRLFNLTHAVKIYEKHKDQSVLGYSPAEETDLSLRDARDRLNKIFASAHLSNSEFMLTFLIFNRGLTFEQVAKEMNRSKHWVKETYSSTMEKLQRAGRIIESGGGE
jgi:DNA-directed RNA polymerase specialized sigma24 family protein